MERGSEGDEIIFLTLRQTLQDFIIPEKINTIKQLDVDLFNEIIIRSLALISAGEISFPTKLPINIASRHRVCTEIASKIKEMGYIGDCGYNQLLYPVENQSKILLTWIIEKLPRIEETAEEVLGANALLNRKISQTLSVWKKNGWKLPIDTKSKTSSISNKNNIFTTVNNYVQTNKIPNFDQLVVTCKESHISISHSIIERNTIELNKDSIYAMELENDLIDVDHTALDENSGSAATSKQKNHLNSYNNMIKNSIKVAVNQVVQKATSTQNMTKDTMNDTVTQPSSMTLADVIKSIQNEYSGSVGQNNDRGTRFSHATEFSQEQITVENVFSSGVRDNSTSAGSHITNESNKNAENKADSKVSKEEAEEQQRAQELDVVKKDILHRATEVETFQKQQTDIASKSRQLENELQKYLNEAETLENSILIKKQTLKMLPEASDNIVQLQTICGASSSRLMQLAQEWEKHRRPLIDKYREKRANKIKRRNKCRQLVEDMKKYREEMIVMIQDLKDKQDRATLLTEEMSKLPKNINRAVYTHRIMDITSQIVKQNKDITKITNDIRDIQKTINSNSSILQRADAIAEELIFSAANGSHSDSSMVDTYRRLKTLRARFEELIESVSKAGNSDKRTYDLETRIDQERARISSQNFDNIQQDLNQILKENQALVLKLKAVGSK